MKKAVLFLLGIFLIVGAIKLYDKINVTMIGHAFCEECSCICEPPDPALIQRRAKMLINVNEKNLYGRTFLHCVSGWSEYEDTVKLLISRKANVNVKDKAGRTPLFGASESSAKLLLAAGADVNAKDDGDDTPLFTVDENVTKLLLAAGADVNVKNIFGETPLSHSSEEKVKLLIDAGADVNVKNKYGETPLFGASEGVAELLLAAGADVNVRDNRGRTPLDRVIDAKVKELLIEHGAKSGKDLK